MDGVKRDLTIDVFKAGIINRFTPLQMEQIPREPPLLEFVFRPREATRLERVKWWLNSKRIALAKWIAGDDWPDEY